MFSVFGTLSCGASISPKNYATVVFGLLIWRWPMRLLAKVVAVFKIWGAIGIDEQWTRKLLTFLVQPELVFKGAYGPWG